MTWWQKQDEMRALGAEHGRSAATWYEIDSTEDARRVRAGIVDCDPEILDSFPAPDLGMFWADSPTSRDLFEAAGVERIDELTPEDENDLLNAYEDAYRETAEAEIERVCLTFIEADRTCEGCGRSLNPAAWILSPGVCGSCVRRRHLRALGQS